MSEAEVFPSPDLIGEPEWQRLLAAAAHGRFPCRDRAILHLLWDHAATPQQLLGLEAAHVDFLSGGLCWPDGRRSRLSPDVLRLLTAYLSMERHPRCPKLFGGRHGLPLGPADIDRLFRRLSALAGIPVDPRTLRRSALLRLLRSAPLRALALRQARAPMAAPAGRVP